ncbi:8-oxoguanine DNA glycosylase [Trypanosoma theileri]|uniref:DNA-(apurinic or apyrimidinic site) lyase n=1 Tax=Trypanosoma theileri TaxID=67003 RepID=A0A1X0P9L2_9TRYP|nr:8-oxoguanine DNA glycosylase [Trypanosoma theileri]ORC93606.1 8-oxoguanine DNA glycosylase [Trypanosoma theileri]
MHHWYTLSPAAAVHLPMTLCGGQCFRWRRTKRDTWVGVIQCAAYELCISSHPPVINRSHKIGEDSEIIANSSSFAHENLKETIWFRCLSHELKNESDISREKKFLQHYLALDVDLEKLWREWTVENSMRDHPLVSHLISRFNKDLPLNIRHLRQDIHETLFAFLCSQNNNVKRIKALLEKFALSYGEHLCEYNLLTGDVRNTNANKKLKNMKTKKEKKGNELIGEWISLHCLPTIAQILKSSEDELRILGFGYRSKYIIECASIIKASGETEWLNNERSVRSDSLVHSYKWYDDLLNPVITLYERREKLLSLPGIGRKVSDCILLFGLGHHELVPVDTHIAQIAAKYLMKAEKHNIGNNNTTQYPSRKRSRFKENLKGEKESDAVMSWETVISEWHQRGISKNYKFYPLSPKHHDAIQAGFQYLFGDYCGWAHSILFYDSMKKETRS